MNTNGSNFPVTTTTTTDLKSPFVPKYSCCNEKNVRLGMNQDWPFYSTISICLTSLETEGLCRIQARNKNKINHLVRRKHSLQGSSITSPDLTIIITIWVQGIAESSSSCTMRHLPLQSFHLVWSLLSCNLPITVCVLWAHVKFLFNNHHFSHSCRCIWLFFNR